MSDTQRDELADLLITMSAEDLSIAYARMDADVILTSDWLAARDRRMKAEALEEAADDLNERFQDLPSWDETYAAGERTDDWMKGGTRMVMDAIDRLRARAAEIREQVK